MHAVHQFLFQDITSPFHFAPLAQIYTVSELQKVVLQIYLCNVHNSCNLPFKTCYLVSTHQLICPNVIAIPIIDTPGLINYNYAAGSLRRIGQGMCSRFPQSRINRNFLHMKNFWVHNMSFEMLLLYTLLVSANVATNTIVPQFSILALSMLATNNSSLTLYYI